MIFPFDPSDERQEKSFRKLLAQQVHHHNECGRGLFESPWSEEDIEKNGDNLIESMLKGRCCIWLYQEDGSICAMCCYRIFDEWIDGVKVAFVDELVVDEGIRGQGVGRTFIQEMEDEMKEQGFDGMQLSCFSRNEGAIEFYRAIGFQVVGIEFEKKFGKDEQDA